MYEGKRIAAVVPAYAEERHIAGVITSMPDIVDIIVVVDDASPDGTFAAATSVADPRCEVIRHEQNQGVGGAIMTAHRRALELGADIDVVFAGDGQMDPTFLPELLDPLVSGDYGFTKANRFYSRHSFDGMPKLRVVGNIGLSFLNKMASGYWNLFDPQNGYTAITRESLERLDFERIAKRYEFENDLLMNLNILNVRAKDVPIPAVYRNETSTIKLRTFLPSIMRLLVKGFTRRVVLKYVIGTFSPIALFLVSGLMLTLFSFLMGLWVLYETIGPNTASTGTVLLCVAPGLVGFQLLLAALQLDIAASPD